jgi:hypothetical protein
MIYNKNAIDLLKEITQKRNWYDGKISRQLAFQYKKYLKENKISYKKAVEILEILGYEKINDESWKRRRTRLRNILD